MSGEHERSLLGAYALGVLDADEVRTVDDHLATCDRCRAEVADLAEMREFLGEVPPEAFLDGPPEGGDLLLQRTLRAVRQERSIDARSVDERDRAAWRRPALVAASVVALAAAVLAGGVVGRQTAPDTVAGPTLSPSIASFPPGTRVVAASDANTRVAMQVNVVPAAGWVRIHAKVEGVKAGEQCQLVVRTRSGATFVAGSWLVSPKGEAEGTALDGSAMVAVTDVASVDVMTFDGRRLVSVPV